MPAIVSVAMFQLTPARGERPATSPLSRSRTCFNSRPRAASDLVHGQPVIWWTCFNSRPRAASDMQREGTMMASSVSTHARARRATERLRRICDEQWFQLTPARGERLNKCRPLCRSQCFNSRPRAASDRLLARCPGLGRVSTHARARRATTWTRTSCPSNSFNSRPRAASDNDTERIELARRVSTHARARRATFAQLADWADSEVSTHARARRATDAAANRWQ